jgi:hypothetical protein
MVNTRALTLALATGIFAVGAAAAHAGNAVRLTNRQLDRITAGAANVFSSTDAQALGVIALTGTTANSVVAGGTVPYPGQPGLVDTAGAADGTALAVGTNLGLQGEPAPSSGTAVTTGGTANGNLVITATVNQTFHGAGGVTFQAGWTFVYGAWVGL